MLTLQSSHDFCAHIYIKATWRYVMYLKQQLATTDFVFIHAKNHYYQINLLITLSVKVIYKYTGLSL